MAREREKTKAVAAVQVEAVLDTAHFRPTEEKDLGKRREGRCRGLQGGVCWVWVSRAAFEPVLCLPRWSS